MTQKECVLSLEALLTTNFPKREQIVSPWLPTGGICMLFGPRGGGKTYATLNLALAVAAGWSFLDMKVPQSRRVLYVDAEMSISEVQERVQKLIMGHGPYPPCTYQNFRLLSHALLDRGIPDLSEAGSLGRRLIEQKSEDVDLIILDNLSSLLRSGIENDAESWGSFNEWLLKLRRGQQAVLVIHHAGKKNSRGEYAQRGTSRREDQMDSVVKLVSLQTQPTIISEWEYTKGRSFQIGAPFQLEISFQHDANGQEVSANIHLADDPMQEVRDYLNQDNLSHREIAKRTGKGHATVSRFAQKLKEE